MQKIVIETVSAYGRLNLTDECQAAFKRLSGRKFTGKEKRDNPHLIKALDEVGVQNASKNGLIKIVSVPAGVKWFIDNDGTGHEWVAEKHRIWE